MLFTIKISALFLLSKQPSFIVIKLKKKKNFIRQIMVFGH